MNVYRASKPIHVLLIEDNPGDISLIREVFTEAKLLIELTAIQDGAAALAYLQQQKHNPSQPDLILLDLNLPKIGGQELLVHIKSDPDLEHIPVVVLTTSWRPEDILQAYEHYAKAYLTKPVDIEQFLAVIREIIDSGLAIVKLPAEAGGDAAEDHPS